MIELFMGADSQIRATPEGFEKFNRWDESFLVQQKMDGIWASAVRTADDDRVHVYSRNSLEKANAAMQPTINDLTAWMPPDSVVVGELGFGSKYETDLARKNGFHRFVCFDILVWEGEDFSDMTTFQRFEILKQKLLSCTSNKIQLVESWFVDKSPTENKEWVKSKFKEMAMKGLEGLMMKPLGMKYHLGTRTPEMVKIKKILAKDYVIVGFTETNAPTYVAKGLTVSAMEIGLFDNGQLKKICKISGFDEDMRRMFSVAPQNFIGKVAEIGCYEVFPSGAARSPWLIRVRDDKPATECTMQDAARLFL